MKLFGSLLPPSLVALSSATALLRSVSLSSLSLGSASLSSISLGAVSHVLSASVLLRSGTKQMVSDFSGFCSSPPTFEVTFDSFVDELIHVL